MNTNIETVDAPVAFTIQYTKQSVCPAVAADQKHAAPELIDAVCTDIKDLGTVSTPFGDKPQIQFTFETEAIDEAERNSHLDSQCSIITC